MIDQAYETYPNAPVRRVVLEVRVPDGNETRLLQLPMQRTLRDRLGSDWVIESVHQANFALGMGPMGPMQESVRTTVIPCFLVRDRTVGLTISDDSLTLEVTKYEGYEAFRELAESVMAAVGDIVAPEGIARVGLRYIDELREMEITRDRPSEWKRWVDPSLLGPCLTTMESEGYRSAGWIGMVQYNIGANRQMQFRFGPRPGPIPYPDGPIRRPKAPDRGPWFLMDFDAGWEPETIPEFDIGTVLTTCDELRAPIMKLFELLTTPELKEHFRKGNVNA